VYSNIAARLSQVNTGNVYRFLTRYGGSYPQRVFDIVKACVDGVVQDNHLKLDDLHKVTHAIADIIQCINESGDVREGTVNLGSSDVAGLVKAIVTLFLQIVLPSTQYCVMLCFVDTQFQMLQLTALPVDAKEFDCPWSLKESVNLLLLSQSALKALTHQHASPASVGCGLKSTDTM
jgi:hypothetical protein